MHFRLGPTQIRLDLTPPYFVKPLMRNRPLHPILALGADDDDVSVLTNASLEKSEKKKKKKKEKEEESQKEGGAEGESQAPPLTGDAKEEADKRLAEAKVRLHRTPNTQHRAFSPSLATTLTLFSHHRRRRKRQRKRQPRRKRRRR